jgi:hypothetical protein
MAEVIKSPVANAENNVNKQRCYRKKNCVEKLPLRNALVPEDRDRASFRNIVHIFDPSQWSTSKENNSTRLQSHSHELLFRTSLYLMEF